MDVSLIKEFSSFDALPYSKIVNLNKMLRDASAELIRLVAFKNEAIVHAIFVDDLQTSQLKVKSGGFSKGIYRSDPKK